MVEVSCKSAFTFLSYGCQALTALSLGAGGDDASPNLLATWIERDLVREVVDALPSVFQAAAAGLAAEGATPAASAAPETLDHAVIQAASVVRQLAEFLACTMRERLRSSPGEGLAEPPVQLQVSGERSSVMVGLVVLPCDCGTGRTYKPCRSSTGVRRSAADRTTWQAPSRSLLVPLQHGQPWSRFVQRCKSWQRASVCAHANTLPYRVALPRPLHAAPGGAPHSQGCTGCHAPRGYGPRLPATLDGGGGVGNGVRFRRHGDRDAPGQFRPERASAAGKLVRAQDSSMR